ncbi:hypothetical protein JTE90_011457 [Oedothorax gibbosus]|uniref:Tudor domain-containing protein n=1 Tax=Oedothorax gibbosus TaxID=931172 RepID=A0AAV6VCZ5_9ARAC|nr:hypothetical protein JTE90_011457 [Oedothorax gibbosus]
MSSRTKRDSFKKGDRVSARWSGSNIFYDAKVVDVTSRNYKVQYDDGSISSIKFSDVKKLEHSNTPPKTTQTPPEKTTKTRISKSRSRSRSAGRARTSRSRSRSPARNEKKTEKKATKKSPKDEKKPTEPTKKSPKEEKKPTETSPKNSNSVGRKATTSSKDTVDGILAKISLTRESVRTAKTETVTKRNSVVKESSDESSSASERPRSARLAALRSAQALRVSNAISKSKYSDDEEEEESEEEEKVPVQAQGLSNTWRTLYFMATLFKMALVPVSLLFLVFACTKKQCTVLHVPQFYSRWYDFFYSIKFPLLGVFGFHLLQALLSMVPLGKKAHRQDDKSGFEYRLNGLLTLLLHVAVFGAFNYFEFNTNFGYDKFRATALSAAIYALLCAIALHIYAFFKGGATTKSKVPFLGGFYNGLYTNPVLFGKLDVKTSFIRAGLIGSVMLNLSIVVKFFLMKGYVSVPLALTSGMQAFFVLDLFAREEKWLTTATYATDSLGYAFTTTAGFLVPFGLAIQNVYLFIFATRSHHIPHWCSGAMVALFFLGYYIYLTSTNMKHNFRKDPFSPSFADIVSIPTSKQKRRLIASGPWGRVRHPNYIGLFIMAFAWTLPCGFVHFVPFGPLILLAIALVIRTLRIEAECLEKYGPAWKNYTEKVRSRLIPYIF